jgi:CheY-like chemotaxis protein
VGGNGHKRCKVAMSAVIRLRLTTCLKWSRANMILYAEDNRLNQMLFQAYLEQRPEIPLVIADSVEMAIAAAQNALPTIAFIDLDLNGRSGLDVLRALKAMTLPGFPSIWCIALTANHGSEYARDAISQGFDEFWTKPIDMTDTLTKIDVLLRRLQP